jgi:prepilin-type N-terminal cleavage/methylation domain-containing protein
MRREQGLTLIEVLAAVVILAVAILVVSMFIQNSSLTSKSTADRDQLLSVTRDVMEEIKYRLSDTSRSETFVYGQRIDLAALRAAAGEMTLPDSIYYPDVANQRIRIEIRTIAIPDDAVPIGEGTFKVRDYFQHVQVTAMHIQSGKSIELDAYIEKS